MRADKKKYIFWIIFTVWVHIFYMFNNGFCITDEAFEMLSRKIKKNTVRLTSKFPDGKEEYGFGFIIGERFNFLYVVTARHVVRKFDEEENDYLKASSVKGRFFHDMGLDHEAIFLDVKKDELDLALMRIRTPEDFIYLENTFSQEIKRNENVWFIGKKRDWYVPLNSMAGGVIQPPDDISGIMLVKISAGIEPGTSGAPLFSEKGIAGLIIRDNEDNSTAISIQTVKKFVESVNYPWGKKSVKSKKFKNSIGMNFVLIPAGSFMMGSPENEPGRDNDEKQHSVTLIQDYYMQTTEVTQGQWKAVMGNNPSYFKDCGDDCPVEKVSWNDVQTFLKKLNRMDSGYSYRLPTEAEWEYAARAGTTSPFAFGNCLSTNDTNYNGKYPLTGCTKGKYRKKTIPVGSLRKNVWGLFDMHGNVYEWCQDWYGEYSKGRVINPAGPNTGSDRVFRGGSWYDLGRGCRSAGRRYMTDPGGANWRLGFRLCASGR